MRVIIRLPDDGWQAFDVPSRKSIEEVVAPFLEITPEIQQYINTTYGTPQERAAEAINPAQVLARINANITATASPIAPTGTVAQILTAAVTEINAMREREHEAWRLLRALAKNALE